MIKFLQCSLISLGLLLGASRAHAASETDTSQNLDQIVFQLAVANMEVESGSLSSTPPPAVAQPPIGDVRYGRFARRLEGDRLEDTRHFVQFAILFTSGIATRAWVDTDFDHLPFNNPDLQPYDYPEIPGARAFLCDVFWNGTQDEGSPLIGWTVRIVVEPISSSMRPRFRLQRVWGHLGTVTIDGKGHTALLFDGNADGLYTKAPLDGMFVDLDDDDKFEIDLLSPHFAPFGVASQVGRQELEVVSVTPDGARLTLRKLGSRDPVPTVRIGSPAPDFAAIDAAGNEHRLSDYHGKPVVIYFWASWCPTCVREAEDVREIHRTFSVRGLQILGVNYDTDSTSMRTFEVREKFSWPSAFSGRVPAEDPIGRRYRQNGVGVFYLVDGEGVLEGIYYRPDLLRKRLEELTSGPG